MPTAVRYGDTLYASLALEAMRLTLGADTIEVITRPIDDTTRIERISIGGMLEIPTDSESRVMSVLFSDIRGFTGLSESLGPHTLKQLLNAVFTPLTTLIFRHQGTIDKYVGDMGSSFRRSYTVIGDAVNLGSRLESLTKYYDVKLLVSEATTTGVSGVVFRHLDRVLVKGKKEPANIYEAVCRESEVGEPLRAELGAHHEALAAYFVGDWDGVYEHLSK